MRTLIFWIMAGLWIAASGCAADRHARQSDNGRIVYATEPVSRGTPFLLFDRVPSRLVRPDLPPLTGENFVYRSTWPSTPGYYQMGEMVFYREWYDDHQGSGFGDTNYLNRRFESYRYGAAYR